MVVVLCACEGLASPSFQASAACAYASARICQARSMPAWTCIRASVPGWTSSTFWARLGGARHHPVGEADGDLVGLQILLQAEGHIDELA